MEQKLILYPAFLMIVLTFFLYVKNSLDNIKAAKDKALKFSYFKAYSGDVPEYIAVSRQTLKNQFELPILFYFTVSIVLIFDKVSQLDLIFSWLFTISRYIHCYIRLSSNYIPYRAKVFSLGLLILIVWWIYFLYNIL